MKSDDSFRLIPQEFADRAVFWGCVVLWAIAYAVVT